MDSFKDILKASGAPLSISKDVEALRALAEIRESWLKLRQGNGPPDAAAFINFIGTLLDETSAGSALTILEQAGLDGTKLQSALQGIADVFHKIDRKYFALVMPVAGFDEETASKNVGLVQWKVLGVQKSEQPTSGHQSGAQPDYSLELGLQASLALEAGDTWPDAQPGVPDPLLRIGFTGGLDVSAKASLPLSLGSLKIGAEAAREAFIDYYFDARNDQRLYATAVVERLGSLPNPWSLDSVMNAVDTSDFIGAIFETKGHSAFSVDVSVTDGFALTDDIKLGASLKFNAKVKRSGTYYLKLRKLPASGTSARALEVTLERKRADESQRAVELGVEIDLAALGRKLADILKRHEGRLKEALEEYRDYLTPGTYLKNAAKDHLNQFVAEFTSDPDLRKALADTFQRTLGLAPPGDDKIVEFLEDKVADTFDAASGVITGAIDDVAKQLGDEFVARTGLPASLTSSLSEKLVGIVKTLREEFENKLDEKLGEAIAKPAEKLKKVGKKKKKAVDKLVADADSATSVVRDAISRYEQALKKLKDAVSDSARMKITAKITAEATTKLERTVDAKLLFNRASDEAAQIYGDIVRGDFDAVLTLIDKSHPDVAVDRGATALTAFKSTGNKFGYTLVLLGFEFGGSTVFDTSSKIVIEGTGKVSVMSELTWKRRTTTSREDREVSFVDSYELLAAKDTEDFTVALGLSHEDEVLKSKEVESLIQSFEHAALVPHGTTNRALRVFTEWFGPGEKKGIVGDLNFAMRMEGKEVLRLLCLGERTGDVIATSGRRRIFEIVLKELIDSGAHTLEHVKKLASIVHAQSNGQGEPSIVEVLFNYTQLAHKKLLADPSLSPTFNKQRIDDLDRAKDLNGVCMSFVDLIDLMGDIFTATPSITKGPGVWTVDEYDAAQAELGRLLKGWLKTGSRLFWIAAEAHPRTIAFIGALAGLAGVAVSDERSIVTLTMTRRSEQPVTVTLC